MSLKTHLALNTLPAPYQKMLLAQHPELKADSAVPFKTVQDALAGKPMADTWLRVAAPNLLRSPEDAQALAQVAKKVYQTVEAPAARSPASSPQASAVSNAPSTQVAPSKVFKGELKWTSPPLGRTSHLIVSLPNGEFAASGEDGVRIFRPDQSTGTYSVKWTSPALEKMQRGFSINALPNGQLAVGIVNYKSSKSHVIIYEPSQSTDAYVQKGGSISLHKRGESLAALPNGQFAVGGADGCVRIYETSQSPPGTVALEWTSPHVRGNVFSLAALPNGDLWVGANNDTDCHVCNFGPGQPPGAYDLKWTSTVFGGTANPPPFFPTGSSRWVAMTATSAFFE